MNVLSAILFWSMVDVESVWIPHWLLLIILLVMLFPVAESDKRIPT